MTKRIDELEDAAREQNRRIAELKSELETERDLSHRLAEQVTDCNNQIDEWKQAFNMMPNDEGVWIWNSAFVEGEEWLVKYGALLREWNKLVPKWNAKIGYGNNVGRPLLASETQCAEVLAMHKAGVSLREIADETNLGFQTVRTIIGRRARTDRTSVKHLERADPERARMKEWMAKKQMRDRLPKKIHELQETGRALIAETRGAARQR